MRVDDLPLDRVQELNQFGTHYIDLDVRGPITITFAGDTIAELIDSPLRNEQITWFVPGVDDTDAQLTAEFDLTGIEQANLKFSTWYDLEEDYDFAYVTVSLDGGSTWELLVPEHARAGEFGPAFNGRSADEREATGGWLKESIALDSYVGRSILIRFEVITDYETDHEGSGQGFALNDISIPELDYYTTADMDSDEWQASGFVQIGLQLPQQWTVQLIEGGPNPRVSSLPLDHLNQGQWAAEIGKGGGVLAITPLTPFIDDAATYWLNITE
jgi:immune inhibitor A